MQPRVMLMKWGITGRRLQIFFFGFCSLVVLFFVYITLAAVWPNLREDRQLKAHSKLYCNEPGNVHGKEGKIPFVRQRERNYELLQVQMVIRHGDRAPISLDTFPNTDSVEISCFFNRSWKDFLELDRLRRDASMFVVTGNPSRVIIQERDVCKGGQLTPAGFLQHIFNGKHLRKAYTGLLESIKAGSSALVTTTDYSRTVQSAAAILYGMFGDTLGNEKFQIDVAKDKYPETHFLIDSNNEPISCKILIRRLRDIWQIKDLVELRKLINPVKKSLAQILNAGRSQIPSLDRIVDDFYTRLCHSKDLPEGPNGKVTPKLASHSFDLSHTLISLKHTPLAELQTLSILSRMVMQASRLIEGKETRKLVIFSGHDTVLVPFLAMLGIHDGKWPPYASRVVFELWRRQPTAEKGPETQSLKSMFDGYFFRILYNGKPLTSEVKFCKASIVDLELCPVTQLVNYVSGDKFNGENFFNRIKNLCSVS